MRRDGIDDEFTHTSGRLFVSKTASFWLGLGFAALVAAPAAAQQPAGTPPDPARVRELLQQVQPPAQPAGEPFVTNGPRVDLTLDEAVQRGLEKNIDIAVARINPQLTDFSLAGLEASYRLNLKDGLPATEQPKVNEPDRRSNLRDELILERKHPLRAAIEPPARLRRFNAPTGAVEELRAEPLLERSHLERHRGLCDAEAVSRLGEAAALDDRAECGKLTRVHKLNLYVRR